MPARPASAGKNRRLSGGFKRAEELENFNIANDDDAERAQAAANKDAEMLRKAELLKSPRKSLAPTPRRQKSAAVIASEVQQCFELVEKGKVDEKNAFALDLLDHMDDAMGGAKKAPDFARAGSTIDAGVKIYAYRVDAVATMAYKALAGLNRTDGGRGAADDGEADGEGAENGDADGEGADGEKKPKRRARKVAEGDALTAHLEPNDAALNVKKLEMAFAVDPLFHRTSAKFDEGGAKGLLLHNLPVRHGTELDFDSAKPPRDPDAAPPAPAALPVGWLASVLPAASADGHVCTAFSTMWAAKERPVGWTSPDVPRPADERAAEEAAAAEEAEAEEEEAAAPAQDDAPLLEVGSYDDAMVDTGFDVDDDDDDASLQAREAALERIEAAGEESGLAVSDVLLGEIDGLAAGDEPSKDEATRLRVAKLLKGKGWAGADFWRPAAPTKADGGAAGAAPKARGAAKVYHIDFSKRKQVVATLDELAIDAKGAALSGAALARASAAVATLPADCHVTVDSLSQLFLKPELRVTRGRRALRRLDGAATSADGAAAASGDGAPIDDDDYDAGVDTGFDAPSPGWAAGGADDADADRVELPGGGFALVDEPTRAGKLEIGYAKVAKQVDIKALKKGMWALIGDAAAKAPPKAEATTTLQQLTGRLPERVAATQLGDVSPAYTFICLLHLANEHGLKLEGRDDFSDVGVALPAAM